MLSDFESEIVELSVLLQLFNRAAARTNGLLAQSITLQREYVLNIVRWRRATKALAEPHTSWNRNYRSSGS